MSLNVQASCTLDEDDIPWASKSKISDSISSLKAKAKADDEFSHSSPGNAKLLSYMDLMVKKLKGGYKGVD